MNTPTPWRRFGPSYCATNIIGADEKILCECGMPWLGSNTTEANAAMIVRAVNAHQALVETLEDLLCLHNNGNEILDSDFDPAREALKLARGEV